MGDFEIVRFKPLYISSVIMFIASLVLIPIDQTIATLLLFSVFALWTRIPTFIHPFLKEIEMIDFLTVFIAINLGPVEAGVFALSNMMFSRLFAPLEWPLYTIKMALSMFVGGLLTPMVYAWSGGNILITMYAFTGIRYVLYLLFTLIFEPHELGLELFYSFTNIGSAVLMNTVTVTLFGPFVTSIMKHKLDFNLELVIMIGAILSLFALSQVAYKYYKKEEHKNKNKKEKRERVRGHLQEPGKFPLFGQ